MALPLDAGMHELLVRAPGYLPCIAHVDIPAKGGNTVVEIKPLDPLPLATRPPASFPGFASPPGEAAKGAGPRATGEPGASAGRVAARAASVEHAERAAWPGGKTLGAAMLGVGGGGLFVGAVAGAVALAKNGYLAGHCENAECPESEKTQLQPSVDTLRTMTAVSTTAFVAGGVLAAAGAWIWLTARPGRPVTTGAVAPAVGAGYVGVEGRF
jgi:hypothetical protein